MASNVLPFFWDLASSSKATRLTASADLVSSLQNFQSTYSQSKPNGVNGGLSDDEEEDEEDEESDDESGEEVDASEDEDEDGDTDAEAKVLDKQLRKENAEDVVYSVQRLVRGLASSRESSRLGFAVALTELLTRINTVSATQVLSLLIRSTPVNAIMKGSEARDALFARLFGINAVIQSGSLLGPSSSSETFKQVIEELINLGQVKAWLRESAWWAVHGALRSLLESQVEWRDEAVDFVVERIYSEKTWNQEKVALTLLLESKRPDLKWKELLSPTFKHTPMLNSHNLPILGKILKESDVDDEEEGVKLSESTGAWKPQLHFVWTSILDYYFASSAAPQSSAASFQDLFRVVVDESLFSNTSSPERKYWGFSVLSKALPLVDKDQLPQLFTPNVMRTWTNNLASSDRYLHQMALNLVKQIQDAVKANPSVGFSLLATLVGKGKVDFDKVTKTKTVEGILNNLSEEGVGEYLEYLQNILIGAEEKNGSDHAVLEEKRQWALSQIHGLFRNAKVPKPQAAVQSILDFLLLHSFFVIKKADKKSSIPALRSAPQPAFSEATATACRAKFFGCLVEVTTASPYIKEGKATHQQGCDASGKLWLRKVIETLTTLEADKKHVELLLDADEEIRKTRQDALSALSTLDKKAKTESKDLARGVEILLSFSLLQTYDENDDALELLEEVNEAAQRMFNISSGKASTSSDEANPPIDTLLDVLIALLDKGSADLRNLANMVVGMVASAFTQTSIEHLIAQLEQTAPETIEVDEEADEDDEDASMEEEDVEEDEEESEAEDEEDASAESESDEEESDDEANLQVDPEFRRRVAEALQVSGMGIDDEGDMDSDDESDEEVWTDEQMLKVDEQLAEVFRQRANAGKSKDFKNLHVQSIHFKTRILDFFDVLVRKQSTNPVVLHIISPLLKLVQRTATTEKDLSTKASNILRDRLGNSKDAPKTASTELATGTLSEVHQAARKATTNEFSDICNACSLFLVRTLDKSPAIVDTYRETLRDFMTRKTTSVRPAFVQEFIKRYPVAAFPLANELAGYTTDKAVKQPFKRSQAFIFLTIFSSNLSQILPAHGKQAVESFVSRSVEAIYTSLESLNETEENWNKDRMREITKYAVHLCRTSRKVIGDDIVPVWDLARLEKIIETIKTGQKTSNLKGLQTDLVGLRTLIVGKEQKAQEKKKAKEAKKAEEGDKMDVDMPVESAEKSKRPKSKDDGEKKKKRKTGEGKEKSSKKAKVVV